MASMSSDATPSSRSARRRRARAAHDHDDGLNPFGGRSTYEANQDLSLACGHLQVSDMRDRPLAPIQPAEDQQRHGPLTSDGTPAAGRCTLSVRLAGW